MSRMMFVVGVCCLIGIAAGVSRGGGVGAGAVQDDPVVPSVVFFYDLSGKSKSEQELIASLAGLVNRTTDEQIMIGLNEPDKGGPAFWLARLVEGYPGVEVRYESDEAAHLRRFAPGLVKGYVFYDREQDADSVNVAATLAGVLDAVVVDPTTEGLAEEAGLHRLADANATSVEEVFRAYHDRMSTTYVINQRPRVTPFLLDFAVMQRAFIGWEPPIREALYDRMEMNGRVFGFGPGEIEFFRDASRHGLGGAPSDWLMSGSTTMGWRVPIETQRTHADPHLETEDGVHYVAFVMSDGDNLQWLCSGFATGDRYFGSPHRGEFTMNWDLSPELAAVNPVAMNYLYRNASCGEHRDYFVTASGRGMVYPSLHPDPQAFADDTAEAMALVDHRVISVLDPDYDLESLYPLLEKPEVLGIMLKTFSGGYRELGGQVFWHEGKPIVSVKHTLWSAIQEPEEMLRLLNEGPRRPLADEGSYTIVNVHPWSNFPVGGDPMSALAWINERLDPHVRVVSLDELMIHLRQNFGSPTGEGESQAIQADE